MCDRTGIPNKFIDEFMQGLSGNALRVYLVLLKENRPVHINLISSYLINLDRRSILSGIRELEEKNIISNKKLTNKEAFDFLCKGKFERGCLFCGWFNSSLDSHHYPIRSKDGGVDTIDICPNCHREFHTLADYGCFEVI